MSELDWPLIVTGIIGAAGWITFLYHARSKKQHTDILSAKEAWALALDVGKEQAELTKARAQVDLDALSQDVEELTRKLASASSGTSAESKEVARSREKLRHVCGKIGHIAGAMEELGAVLDVMKAVIAKGDDDRDVLVAVVRFAHSRLADFDAESEALEQTINAEIKALEARIDSESEESASGLQD